MFVGETDGLETAGGGGAIALKPMRILAPQTGLRRRVAAIGELDLLVDLGARIGSREWWRGLATCTALCGAAISFAPGFHAIPANVTAPLAPAEAQEMRAQAISPAAFGSDTGKRMVATDLVEPLAETPERPSVDLTATLGSGDGFVRVLSRNGVGEAEARQAADLVAGAVALGDIRPGTKLDLTLGRRPNKQVARPLDHLAFRAKFELALELKRVGQGLTLIRKPIAVDETPLRLQGRVGSSLFASARSAGVPAGAIQTYLRAMAQHIAVGSMRATDRFDFVIEHRRAATGETETGGLLLAGLDNGKKALRLVKWQQDGREKWFTGTGTGETSGNMKMPVQGRLTSSFGMRGHPVLGYSRMHRGVDYGAPSGSPILAATDGVVTYSGWHGGHGNYVMLRHGGGMATGYGHMSRILARNGEHVRTGQVIGYVGSTGLSTGPHLHFEVFQGGVAVNPLGVKFAQTAQLAGNELARLKGTLARLLAVRVAG